MEKIYVLTAGCYSDYHIVTATTDYELAVKIQEKYNRGITYEDDLCRIEEYNDAEEMLLTFWNIEFDEKGNVCQVAARLPSTYDSSSVYFYRDKSSLVRLFAEDYETAVKSAAERRAKILAEREGL